MRKNKGFTLIELLAVIVILAIIALITVPAVLNIIDNAKKGAAEDSAYGVKKSADYYYVTKLYENQGVFNETSFTCTSEGCVNSTSEKLDISGTIPTAGTITIASNGTVSVDGLVVNGFTMEYANGKFTAVNS